MRLSEVMLPEPLLETSCVVPLPATPAPQVRGDCPMSLRGECKGRVVKREFVTNHNSKKREQRIAAAVAGQTASQQAAKAQHSQPKHLNAAAIAIQAIMSSSSNAVPVPSAYKHGLKNPTCAAGEWGLVGTGYQAPPLPGEIP